jgi:cell wall assembly regulator SMI1
MEIQDANEHGRTTIKEIRKFESKFGISIPEEFQAHLLEHNGGYPSPADFNTMDNTSNVHGGFYGLHKGPEYLRLDSNLKIFSERVPPSLLPIASDAFGNQICIGVSKDRFGKIFFWDHEISGDEAVEEVAQTFREFLADLYEWADPNESSIEKTIRKGSLEDVKAIVNSGYDIETKDENGRTVIEKASIHARNEIIEYLWRLGAKLGNSLKIAEDNAQFFEGHKETVTLIKKLQK